MAKTRKAARAKTYKVICISIYHEDLEALDEKVDALKAMGSTRASRSAVIRAALDATDVAELAALGVGERV